jgi:hypothetical protein
LAPLSESGGTVKLKIGSRA